MDSGNAARIKALMREVEELREQNRKLLREKTELHRKKMEAQEDADRQRKRADKAEKRANKAEERADKAEKRARKAKEQTQKTTLEEYLDACQEHLYNQFTIETDRSRASRSDATNPTKKWCPTKLLPWTDFLDKQKAVLGELYAAFPLHERLFMSARSLKDIGYYYIKGNIRDEVDVGYVQRMTVQVPVAQIISEIAARPHVRDALGVGSDMEFKSHVPPASENVAKSKLKKTGRKINNGTDKEIDNETDNRTDNRTENEMDNEMDNETDTKANNEADDDSGDNNDKIRPGQTVVDLTNISNHNNLNKRAIAFVAGYGDPHKLTDGHLSIGVREMDILAEVVNRPDIPDPEHPGRFEYNSERLVAAAITQIYHYMIEHGLQYSYLTTSEAFMFLKIDWRNPGNLYFHLAKPRDEVAAHGRNGRHCTAVSQVLAFSILALRTRQKPQDARIRARKRAKLNKWAVDCGLMMRAATTPTETT
ncbi:hypothetical protein B0I37DRAFT_429477 [Chaetomium sp. MPI-CAGE-AT-0009]|nr:hypothetical protein B0I37DRAFT_429477 [Chaetomium sp. MPI-CAGE-AT-0009]